MPSEAERLLGLVREAKGNELLVAQFEGAVWHLLDRGVQITRLHEYLKEIESAWISGLEERKKHGGYPW